MKIISHMMNGARMGTGLQALAYASSAYLLAVNYARKRYQERDLMDFKNPDVPSVAIINHPDVRRNLLCWKPSRADAPQLSIWIMTLLAESKRRQDTKITVKFIGTRSTNNMSPYL